MDNSIARLLNSEDNSIAKLASLCTVGEVERRLGQALTPCTLNEPMKAEDVASLLRSDKEVKLLVRASSKWKGNPLEAYCFYRVPIMLDMCMLAFNVRPDKIVREVNIVAYDSLDEMRAGLNDCIEGMKADFDIAEKANANELFEDLFG